MTTPPTTHRSQTARSTAMRQRLIGACIECLIETGYARTTTVAVCEHAGVTRGALLHHFASLPELLAETLTTIYTNFLDAGADNDSGSNSQPGPGQLLRLIWSRISRREFKAVIELWFAARNDPLLAESLRPVIDRYSGQMSPESNIALGEDAEKSATMFRLAIETMIGLAVGRAISHSEEPLAHEQAVLDLLIEQIEGNG